MHRHAGMILGILGIVTLAGCTPDLGNAPPAEEPPVGDDDNATESGPVDCWSIGEDFWDDSYNVYRLDPEAATAELVMALPSELWAMPALGALDGVIYAFDDDSERMRSIDLSSGQVGSRIIDVPEFHQVLGLVNLGGGLTVLAEDDDVQLLDLDLESGDTSVRWALPAGPYAFGSDADLLFGLHPSGGLGRWRLSSAGFEDLGPLTLGDLTGYADGVEVLDDVVLVILNDELHRFDAATGASLGPPTLIVGPGDASFFVGLVCAEAFTQE